MRGTILSPPQCRHFFTFMLEVNVSMEKHSRKKYDETPRKSHAGEEGKIQQLEEVFLKFEQAKKTAHAEHDVGDFQKSSQGDVQDGQVNLKVKGLQIDERIRTELRAQIDVIVDGHEEYARAAYDGVH